MDNTKLYSQIQINDINIQYFIVSEPICMEREDILRYGIMIHECCGLQFVDGRCFPNLFFNYEEVEYFIKMLMKFRITVKDFVNFLLGYLSAKEY